MHLSNNKNLSYYGFKNMTNWNVTTFVDRQTGKTVFRGHVFKPNQKYSTEVFDNHSEAAWWCKVELNKLSHVKGALS